MWNSLFKYTVHDRFRFPDRQAADRVAREVHGNQVLRTLCTEIAVLPALYDSEQRLGFVPAAFYMIIEPAFCPPGRTLYRVLDIFVLCRMRRAFIERHHDIRAEIMLDVHRPFRAQEKFGAVQVAPEMHTRFLDLPSVAQAEYLEAACVRQDRPVPVHESMKAARLGDNVTAGPQPQMIGIA